MKSKRAVFILLRYLILIILAFDNLAIFYLIFTPLTFYPSAFILSLITNTASNPHLNQIILNGIVIELIPACIAGSAYYLLLILNLTTPLKPAQRAKSIAFLFISFLFVNILRIVLFSLILGWEYFNVTHKAIWYIGSTIFVVALWFINVKIFNITSLPVYTDLKHTIYEIKHKNHKSL